MKSVFIVLSVLFGTCLMADEKAPPLYPLTVNQAFPPQYQKAALAVVSALTAQGMKAREYSAEITSREGGRILEFALWHDSALKERAAPSSLGDPTGKCRTAVYDVEKGKVTRLYGWR